MSADEQPFEELDITRRGARKATKAERALVQWHLEQFHYDAAHRTTAAKLCRACGIDGRVLRACFKADDTRAYLLAGGDDGLWLAQWKEEAERMTRRMERHALSELDHVARRRAYGEELPPRQLDLGL